MTPASAATAPRESPKTAAGRSQLMAFIDDAASEGIMRDCLAELGIQQGIFMRGGVRKAIEHLSSQRSPYILIVDISEIELPVSEVHRLAEVCEPGVTVIALGKRNDIGLYRDLLQAGVADYIAKPITHQLAAKSLRAATGNVAAAPINQKLGKLVTVVGTRGGVGTSTLAVNLAWHLANKRYRRVALVDFDLQSGDCALMLNVKATSGLREALENPGRVDNIFLERAMIPVGERLFLFASEEPIRDEVRVTPEAVDTLIAAVRAQFHYVVLDLPRIASVASRRALDAAEVRIIVADQTLRSVRDVARLRPALGAVDATRRSLLVINRSGEGGRHEVRLDDFGATVEMRPNSVIPYLPKMFASASSKATLPAERGGPFKDAVAHLTLEMSGRPPKKRWWRRIFK